MVIKKCQNPIIIPPNNNSSQFQLIDLVISLPSENYDVSYETQARPFEFIDNTPSRYSVMCPFCCAGFFVYACDITEKYGHKFTWCPECGVGKPFILEPPKPFIDPFVNPFFSKQLLPYEFDETITAISDVAIKKDDSLTVAQKMLR